MKHDLFDCVTPEPHPIIGKWLERGHELWIVKELYGENAGPIVWGDPGFFGEVAIQTAKPGTTGLIGFHNALHSHRGYRYKMQHINLESFFGYLGDPGFDGAEHMAASLAEIFPGQVAERIGSAISLYKEMVFGISRVVGISFEGYTFKWQLLSLLKGPQKWPGTLGTEGDDEEVNLTPPALAAAPGNGQGAC